MKRLLCVGVLLLAVMASRGAWAAGPQAWVDGLPGAWASGAHCDPYVDYNCAPPKVSARALKGQPCDPYVNYNCLDAYLGDDVVTRFLRYYQLEWGKAAAPSDPKAPPSRRSDAVWPATPQPTPPMPFTEWPYGGSEAIGVTRPNSVDSRSRGRSLWTPVAAAGGLLLSWLVFFIGGEILLELAAHAERAWRIP